MTTEKSNKGGLAKSGDTNKIKTFKQAGFKDALPAPMVIHGATNNSTLARTADYAGTMGGNNMQQPTLWFSPELTPDSWLLPKSRIETLRWCKIYYNLNPYIHSILNMHAQYGFSRFTLQYKDPNITKLFNTLLFHNQEFDWYQFTLDIALSYYKYGEAVCLTGDTAIRLFDGTTKTLKELHDNKASNFVVYSIDAKGNMVPGKADTVVLSKKNANVLKITLDTGLSFKCTPNHKCMLQDGTYVEAKDLKSGMEMKSLYTSENEQADSKNHTVVSVVESGSEDVYDIRSVEGYHNFALDCGVFVHNCWGSWNSARRTWDRFTLIDPALVEYKEDLFTGHSTIELIPTVEMKQTVKEAIMQGRRDIDPMLLDAVQNNKKLPLDTEGTPENVFTGQKYSPAKVFVFARRTDVSSSRGTSALQCLFKDLIYGDQLRMSQIAVAQKTQLPVELWTVGHLGSDEQSSILPGPEMLEEVRTMITNATQQPPYSIVYGPYLKYEALGVSGKLLDIYNDLGYVENQILVGLGVNKAVILGEGPNVQGKAISLNRLVREYAVVRDLFSNFVKKYILLPIAKANNLMDEDGQYIVPEIVWELSLSPEKDKENFDLCYKMWKDGLISTMSLFEKCPEKFDYTLEMTRLEEERGSIFDKQDKRLGRAQSKGSSGGGSSSGGTGLGGGASALGDGSDGKGNQDLVDFALGEGAGDSLPSDTSVGDGSDSAGPDSGSLLQ